MEGYNVNIRYDLNVNNTSFKWIHQISCGGSRIDLRIKCASREG